MSEFRVNDFLTLKLEGYSINIYIKGKKIGLCGLLSANLQLNNIDSFEEIYNIVDKGFRNYIESKIPIEDQFWGSCSILQVWFENNYNTDILQHSQYAFSLLKRLTDAGDPVAKRVFKEEIVKRLKEGYLPLNYYLYIEGFLDYLNKKEKKVVFLDLNEKLRESILKAFEDRDFPRLKDKAFNILVKNINMGDISAKELMKKIIFRLIEEGKGNQYLYSPLGNVKQENYDEYLIIKNFEIMGYISLISNQDQFDTQFFSKNIPWSKDQYISILSEKTQVIFQELDNWHHNLSNDDISVICSVILLADKLVAKENKQKSILTQQLISNAVRVPSQSISRIYNSTLKPLFIDENNDFTKKNRLLKEIKINENISLKLSSPEYPSVLIYVREKCIGHPFALLTLNSDYNIDFDDVMLNENFNYEEGIADCRTIEFYERGEFENDLDLTSYGNKFRIWAENNYSLRLLHINIALPILKELVKVGDNTAAKVLSNAILRKIKSVKYYTEKNKTIRSLQEQGYLQYLNEKDTEELENLGYLP